jgi:hypothetical protein
MASVRPKRARSRPRTHPDCLDGRDKEVLSPTTDNVVGWEGNDLVWVTCHESSNITGKYTIARGILIQCADEGTICNFISKPAAK